MMGISLQKFAIFHVECCFTTIVLMILVLVSNLSVFSWFNKILDISFTVDLELIGRPLTD